MNSTEEVAEIVKISKQYRVPITPFSGGTSLEGHFSSVRLTCYSFNPSHTEVSPWTYLEWTKS